MLFVKLSGLCGLLTVSALNILFPPQGFHIKSGVMFAVIWEESPDKHNIHVFHQENPNDQFPVVSLDATKRAHIFPEGFLKVPGTYEIRILPDNTGGDSTGMDVESMDIGSVSIVVDP